MFIIKCKILFSLPECCLKQDKIRHWPENVDENIGIWVTCSLSLSVIDIQMYVFIYKYRYLMVIKVSDMQCTV